MAPALKANRLEKEFKTASDDRKKQIVDKLKDTRSELNKLNKEQSVLDLRKAAAGLGGKGLVARTSDGSIITDSSGNPIMLTAGREVFDKTRGKFSKEAGRLLEESPELYKGMYPISYGLQKGIPKLMEFAPGIGTLGRIAKATLGKAKDTGSGIMGTKIAQDLAAAPKGFLGDLRSMIGDIGGIFSKGISGIGNRVPNIPQTLGGIGAGISGKVQEGGDIIGGIGSGIGESIGRVLNPQVIDSIYGSGIGVTGPVTGDFIDSDGDGVDDRYQMGPGQPDQRQPEQTGMIGGVNNMMGQPAITPANALANPIMQSQMLPGIQPVTQQLQLNPNTMNPFYQQGIGSFRI